MSIKIDEAQKKAITIDRNAVVSAGAGSGKTRVIAERFSYLVREKKIRIDEILTLTFTKKATTEMYSRIWKTLKNLGADTSLFYKAHIQTLDSYCMSIAKTGAHFYGITPDFSIDQEALEERIKKEALPFLLEHKKILQPLIGFKKIDEVAEQIFANVIIDHSFIENEIDFKCDFEKQKNELKIAWNNYAKKTNDALFVLREEIRSFDGNKVSLFEKVQNAISDTGNFSVEEIDEDNFTVKNFANETMQKLNIINKINLSGGNKDTKPISETVKNIRALFDTLTQMHANIASLELLQNLIPLFETFQRNITRLKKTSGLLSYSDVSFLALSILKNHPELRALEKRKYKAIMIDEFQDNNALQKDLLFLLAENLERNEVGVPNEKELEGDKLFFVGDEKQSIYRFRKADVSVFRSLSKTFSNGNIFLQTNYRSDPRLVENFNVIFGGENFENKKLQTENCEQNKFAPSIFFTENDDEKNIPAFEAIYHAVSSSPEKEKSSEQNLHIALYETENKKNEDADTEYENADDTEAMWVAKKIRALIDEKKYAANDIAILFRTTAPQKFFERALLKERIPYTAEKLASFFDYGLANDMFAFLRLLSYPNDFANYIAVLKSPFVNFSHDAILKISEEFQNEKNKTKDEQKKFFPFQSKVVSDFDTESISRFENAKQLFFSLTNKIRTASIAELVSFLWNECGYRYETLWNKNLFLYTNLFDKIFELARLADSKAQTLADFVDEYREKNFKELKIDVPLESQDGVHLLTIHGSKGLEFPVVFAVQIHKRGQDEKKVSPIFFSKNFGITLNTHSNFSENKTDNYFFEKEKAEIQKEECAELKRLFYVACTRAEKELFITGKISSHSKKEKKENADESEKTEKNFLTLLEPIIDFYKDKDEMPFDFEAIFPIEKNCVSMNSNTKTEKFLCAQKAKTFFDNAKVLEMPNVLPRYKNPSSIESSFSSNEKNENVFLKNETVSNAQNEIPFFEINKLVYESIPEGSTKPLFSFADFGSIAHAYFEAFISGKAIFVKKNLTRGLEGSEKKLREVETICLELQKKFAESEIGKQAKKSLRKKTEWTFVSKIEGTFIKGSIDLIYQNADGTYTLVDYKTNQSESSELYETQLALYLDAASNMLKTAKENIRCVLYYMRTGNVVDITENCLRVKVE